MGEETENFMIVVLNQLLGQKGKINKLTCEKRTRCVFYPGSSVNLRNETMVTVRLSSYECTRKVWGAGVRCVIRNNETMSSGSLASRVLSKLYKCIHNSIDAQLNHTEFVTSFEKPNCKVLNCNIFFYCFTQAAKNLTLFHTETK